MRRRRSHPQVTADAPTHEELLPLVEAAATVADHGDLKPWRLIELRDDARVRLGAALVAASGDPAASKLAEKPLRASLLIAVVAVHQPSFKVAEWEQDAAASGIAHALSLLLDEAGWGVMWRSGPLTRSGPVAAMHGLAPNETLLGWLYVGGIPEKTKAERPNTFTAERLLSQLD
ncbi:NAD(P)H nitroreductase [soil metagenome]